MRSTEVTSPRTAGSGGAAFLVLWALIVSLAVGFGIGGYGLIEPDEGRNAEVAREMAATNDYVLPRLEGLPYLDKPVLFFAAVAAVIEVFGPTELAARAVPLLFGLATALLCGWFARRLWGREAALVAATATATAPLALGLSRVVIMDTMLSFFVVLALIGFYLAVEERAVARPKSPASRRWLAWSLVAWVAMGLGVLTKGPVAFAVPLLVATPFALRRRSRLAVWQPLGPVVMLGLVLPWVWAVSREIPNFMHYVIFTETWARMTSDELHRTEPVWFFLPVLLGGTFPWSILALANLRSKAEAEASKNRTGRLFLLLWLVVPLVLFSLSRGKQEQYVLPLVPAVALLVASRWSDRPRGLRPTAVLWGIFGLALLVFAVFGAPGLEVSRLPAGVVVATATGLGTAALLGGALAWFGQGRRRLALVGLALPLLALPVVGADPLASVAADRSTRELARAIETRLTPETELLWVEAYAPGLSFYLRRTIPVASSGGDEFRSNYILRNPEAFRSETGSLRPLESAQREMASCEGPEIFLLATRSRGLVESLAATGRPVLEQNRHWTALGPECEGERSF